MRVYREDVSNKPGFEDIVVENWKGDEDLWLELFKIFEDVSELPEAEQHEFLVAMNASCYVTLDALQKRVATQKCVDVEVGAQNKGTGVNI